MPALENLLWKSHGRLPAAMSYLLAQTDGKPRTGITMAASSFTGPRAAHESKYSESAPGYRDPADSVAACPALACREGARGAREDPTVPRCPVRALRCAAPSPAPDAGPCHLSRSGEGGKSGHT